LGGSKPGQTHNGRCLRRKGGKNPTRTPKLPVRGSNKAGETKNWGVSKSLLTVRVSIPGTPKACRVQIQRLKTRGREEIGPNLDESCGEWGKGSKLVGSLHRRRKSLGNQRLRSANLFAWRILKKRNNRSLVGVKRGAAFM